jgi:hypothetical protein
MKRMDAAGLIALYNRASQNQQEMHQAWDELARYIRPSMSGMVSPRVDGEKRTTDIWDSTAPQAVADLGNYLSAGMTPSASPWLNMVYRQAELNEQNQYVEWLQTATEVTRSELLRSNFYSTMGELYQDLPTFGNAALSIESRYDQLGRWEAPHYEAIWLKELLALADEYGDLSTTFRCYEQTALQWVGKFGDDVGEDVRKLAAEKPETPVKFLHVVYPRDIGDIDQKGTEMGTAEGKKMPYASVWVNLKDKNIVRESGYLELPRAIVRWAKASSSIWGYGPGHLALPDIRTLNEAVRLELAAWERTIDRPMVTEQNNIIGDLNLGPGGLTTVRKIDALRPLIDGTDFSLTAVKTDELRTAILRTFFADLIREPADVKSGTTAYEVAKRIERAQRILGESVGHLQTMLKWVVERTFKILLREGRFPPMPEGLLEAGASIDIQYTSPLRQAQEAQGVEQLTLFLGDMAQMAAIQREAGQTDTALDWVDFDGAAQEIAKRRNTWAAAVRSDDDVEALREARAQAMAQQQMLEQQQQGAGVLKDLSSAVGPERALQVVNG